MSRSFLFVAAMLLGASGGLSAAETEYDECTCKQVQAGAQSTLRGGVCQRTEAGKCLMQWGAQSKQKVPVGNGLSQEEAASKAEDSIRVGLSGDFKISPLAGPGSDKVPPLQIALVNLARLPPDTYDRFGMAESFILVAGTALVRFDAPLAVLAKSALGENRKRLVEALQKEGGFQAGPFEVRGRRGCLQIEIASAKVTVYIKTPFAPDERC